MKKGSQMIKRVLSFVMALAMVLTLMPVTALAADTRTIYLNAGGSSLWDQGGAWFAAWVWGSSESGAWYTFEDTDVSGIYKIEIPSDSTGMKILRMSSGASSPSWDKVEGNGNGHWNNTGDLTISSSYDCYTITGWGESDGTWSTYTYVEPTYIIAGAPDSVFGNEWNPGNASNTMTKNSSGVYEKVYTNVAAGEVQFKVTDGSWTNSWGDSSTKDGNVHVTVAEDGSTLTITFNASTKAITATVKVPVSVTFTGTNVTSNGAAEGAKGTAYTATLSANAGYSLPESITVTVGGSALSTSDYTYTNGVVTIPSEKVTGDIAITAVGVANTYDVTFEKTAGITYTGDDTASAGTTYTATLTAVAGYTLPETITVMVGSNAYTGYTYENGSLSIPGEAIIGNITIKATAQEIKTYTVTFAGTNVTSSGEETIAENAEYKATLTAATGYTLPDTIEVKIGTTVLGTDDYTYVDGMVTIPKEKVTGNITITAEGVEETTETITVYFRNDWLWPEVYVHYWDGTKGTEWPGEKMTKVGTATTNNEVRDVYSAEIPTWATGLLFNGLENGNNSNRQQTPNVTDFADGKAYYIYWDEENKCSTFDYVPAGDEDEGEKTTYTAIFHFANTVGWSPVNLYVWNDDGATTGSWPGTAITKQDENGYHTMTVTWEATANKGLNYIFNNGSVQTVDLSLEASLFDAETNTAEVWVELNATANSNGKYEIKQVKSEDLGIALAVSPKVNGTSVTFEYVGNSSTTSVEVRGTVPDGSWDSGISMTKNAKGIWTVTVDNLPPAVYEYKFVVNGNDWTTDPANGKTNSSGNSVFTIVDPSAVDTGTVTINVYYDRKDYTYVVENADGNETGTWNAYVWGDGISGTRYDFAADSDGNMVTTITVNGRNTQNVYLKPRMSTASKDWLKEESQVSIPLDNIVSGTINVYVVSDGKDGNAGNLTYSVVTGTDIVVANKVTDVQLDYDTGKITVTTMDALNDPMLDLAICNSKDTTDNIEIQEVKTSGNTYTLTLNKELDLVNLYQYEIVYDERGYDIGIDSVYASDKFAEKYTYTGSDLGATYSTASTTFKVWAPTAEAVSVKLYTSGTKGTDDLEQTVAMTPGDNGVWYVTVNGNLNGKYYTYSVKVNGETVEAVDPYAHTTGVNGNRGMVIDLDSTDPDGWSSDSYKTQASYTDAIIYELHVRDFSIDSSSGMTNKGKYLAFTENRTTVNGEGEISTGIDYLKNLGVNYVHLLPVYDYASVDETTSSTFNWGYDPQNYNTPEGSYSTDPYNGEVRVKEFKQMVQSLHNNGIGVIMDVVYNHVYNADTFCFNNIVPGYFSRVDSNRSGCGNDTASEREMVRKYIVESVLYWHQEYHIDGFRFDLVGLLDVETINEIVKTVHACCPDVIFYGEGWDMDSTNKEPGTEMAKQGNASKTPGFAYFSDSMRDLLAGNAGNPSLGFVSGASGKESSIVSNFMANPGWTSNPTQVVQYASCHDNYTLIDRILLSLNEDDATDATIMAMNNLAATIYMTSQGISFIHAGEEILREKVNADGTRNHNSYNSSDAVNSIKWANLEDTDYADTYAYYKGLIEFRKAHAALRYSTASKVSGNVKNTLASGNVVAFQIDGNAAGDDDIYIIFNANSSATTVTLPDGTWTIYINGEDAGTTALGTVSGSVQVAGISAMVLTKPDEGKDAASATTEKTIYFSNNKGWEKVYAYVWDGNGDPQNGNWPGAEMTYVGTNDYNEAIYSVTLPASETGINVIFNSGNNGEQTVDIVPGVDGTGYYCTEKNSDKWEVGSYTYRAANVGTSSEYFLMGYINGADYMSGDYKFDENGKLTVTFNSDSYVYVRNGDGSKEYWTDGWLGTVTSATLYDTNKCSPTQDKWDKMMIPGGVEVTFTLTVNSDNTVTLSYETESDKDSYSATDTSGIQNGVTLHCWNWSFKEIEANMAKIAEQGYTAIQTSPVQPLKETTSGVSTEKWWLYYQPVNFTITDAEGNALGTKDDLENMIETAHKYGIKVIVDVVANHLANNTGNDLSTAIPEDIRTNTAYWHKIDTNITNWSDRYDMTQYCMGGLPDLNTANDDIQNMVLDFLKDCIDIGVDGFRFDAAKSIETPEDDSSFASDFWPTVVGGAEEYAESKGKDIYCYGEVLDTWNGLAVSAYTKYMAITDNSWGNTLRESISSGTASISAGYNKAANASQLVIWAESHDTYANSDGTSKDETEAEINMTWALVAARADAMGLYLARPENMTQVLGTASVTGWANAEVKAVNEFHNAFVGKNETVGSSGNIAYVVRDTTGVVLVNAAGTTATVSGLELGMTDGTYTDQITGNTFTVVNGKISGKIGSTGIAVVYNASENHVTIKETTGGTVTVDDVTPDAGDEVIVTVTPDSGNVVNKIKVTDKDGKTVTVIKNENGTYSYVQPKGDVTIEVTFKAATSVTYKVTVEKTTGGKVEVSDTTPKVGDTVTITVTPDDEMEVGSITVKAANGADIAVSQKTGLLARLSGDTVTYTFTQPASDVTVAVTFKTKSADTDKAHKVSVESTSGGKVTVDDTTPETGDTVTITVKPNSGKAVKSVTVTDADGNAVTVKKKNSKEYTFTQPDSDVTVKVTFKSASSNAQTGDTSNVGVWIGIMAVSLLAVVILIVVKRKKDSRNK